MAISRKRKDVAVALKRNLPAAGNLQAVTRFLSDEADLQKLFEWPPDAFALVGYIFKNSGAYRTLVDRKKWARTVSSDLLKAGSEWRKRAADGLPPPLAIRKAIKTFGKHLNFHLNAVESSPELLESLLIILLAADEACVGCGIPWSSASSAKPTPYDSFATQVYQGLVATDEEVPASLCRLINPWIVTVLPKLHTPQSGLTLRSLTHHLALCPSAEVRTKWKPFAISPTAVNQGEKHGLNILIVPWPLEISPLQFASCDDSTCGPFPLAAPYGYFKFISKPWTAAIMRAFEKLVLAAIRRVGRLDFVILPEISITEAEHHRIYRLMKRLCPDALLVSGAGGNSKTGECLNKVITSFPFVTDVSSIAQSKHHRWKLDGDQIRQYGLSHRLDPELSSWEHIRLPERELHFISLSDWLTFCTLICEDLAQQDPVPEIIRSVGPNLVLALLMDGPQLQSRWPARYATVLAEDPGSSVLTLTCLGMILLSRKREAPPDSKPSRSVALWKDRGSKATEIELQEGNQGVVLVVSRQFAKEYSADGRDDGGMTAYLHLAETIQISYSKAGKST